MVSRKNAASASDRVIPSWRPVVLSSSRVGSFALAMETSFGGPSDPGRYHHLYVDERWRSRRPRATFTSLVDGPEETSKAAGVRRRVSHAVAHFRCHGAVGGLDVVSGAGTGAPDDARPVGRAVCQSVHVGMRGPAEPHLQHSRAWRSPYTAEALSRRSVCRRDSLSHRSVFRMDRGSVTLQPLFSGPCGVSPCGSRA